MASHAHVLCIMYLFSWFPSMRYLRWIRKEWTIPMREILYPQTLNIYIVQYNKISKHHVFHPIIKTRVSVPADSSSSVRFHLDEFSTGHDPRIFTRDLVHINNPNIRYKSARCTEQPQPEENFPFIALLRSLLLPLSIREPKEDPLILSWSQFSIFSIFSQLSQLSKRFYSSKKCVQSGWCLAATWKIAPLCSTDYYTRRRHRTGIYDGLERANWTAVTVVGNQRFELLQLAGWPTNFSRIPRTVGVNRTWNCCFDLFRLVQSGLWIINIFLFISVSFSS